MAKGWQRRIAGCEGFRGPRFARKSLTSVKVGAGSDKARRSFEPTFDAINLIDQAEIVCYNADDSGRIVSGNSAFGRSYPIGARVKF